jgi:hypothetical protein
MDRGAYLRALVPPPSATQPLGWVAGHVGAHVVGTVPARVADP